MWIKFTQDTSFGKKGNVIQMNDGDAGSWIRTGMAVKSDPPATSAESTASKRVSRKKLSNKSLSAAE